MTFLPIVERELRVAARRRFTFWSRLSAAGFALVIFGALQLLAQMAQGAFPAGQVEFAILKWLAFGYACAAGLFLTADCLSEEKREGTLGLLFLTDLRGYDVVFGKLLSQSLRAFYALLAAFPIMGLALLSGGVTGGEFWRAVLVICNTLFFSLALGMFVSSLSRDSTKAMSGTLLLIVLILGGLPLADLAAAGWDPVRFKPLFSLANPGYLFTHSGAYRFPQYWWCLGLQQILAWAFLVVASLRAPHAWQEKSAVTGASRPSLSHRWRFGGPRARAAMRRRLLDQNPVLWLALRDRWLPRMVWSLTLIVLLTQSWNLIVNYRSLNPAAATHGASAATNSSGPTTGNAWSNSQQTTVVGSSTNSSGTTVYYSSSTSMGVSVEKAALTTITTTLEWLLHLGLYLWVASQAARFFVDAIRNGALEQLLVTPVSPGQIVRGQWTALRRIFLFPTCCVVLLQLGGVVLAALQMNGNMVASTGTAAATTAATTPARFNPGPFQIIAGLIGVVTFVAGLAAVGWFGMWMGLKNRKTSVAILKTVCFVFVLPWIAFVFVQIFISLAMIPAALSGNLTMMMVIPMVLMGALNLAKDCFFIWWARLSLRVHFRKAMAQEERVTGPAQRPSPGPPALPPSLPPLAATS